MARNWLRLCSCVLLLVFPASVMASDAVGILNSNGEVWIEGARLQSSAAVFPGDNIQTGSTSYAILSHAGMTISLAPNSVVRVEPGAVDISSGTIIVSGPKAQLRVNGTLISTQGALGKFLVRSNEDNLKIVALAGSILVGEGQDQTTVPATTGVNVGKKGKKDKGADQTSGSNVGKRSWLSNPDIGILIAVSAAVAAGVAVGIVNSQNSKAVSPAAP